MGLQPECTWLTCTPQFLWAREDDPEFPGPIASFPAHYFEAAEEGEEEVRTSALSTVAFRLCTFHGPVVGAPLAGRPPPGFLAHALVPGWTSRAMPATARGRRFTTSLASPARHALARVQAVSLPAPGSEQGLPLQLSNSTRRAWLDVSRDALFDLFPGQKLLCGWEPDAEPMAFTVHAHMPVQSVIVSSPTSASWGSKTRLWRIWPAVSCLGGGDAMAVVSHKSKKSLDAGPSLTKTSFLVMKAPWKLPDSRLFQTHQALRHCR